LRHSDVAGATMEPSMPTYCDTTQLTLEPDDIAGIRALYPPLGNANTAPAVSIASPGANSSFSDTTNISFSGTASDSQDGNLTANLKWTSNLIGQIGTGGSFGRTLPVGVHVITASVTDSGGLVSSKQVTVTILASAPATGTPTLSAQSSKGRGVMTVNLSWSGFGSAMVGIYRNQALIGYGSAGTATDTLNSKGNYYYVVCASGTCSNTVRVHF